MAQRTVSAAFLARHVIPELEDAPGQHSGGERLGEAELDVVVGVVVPTLQVDPGARRLAV